MSSLTGAVSPADLDADRIRAALDQADGKVTVASRYLGLNNRYQLYRLMEKHGIKNP
jgi:transcriptional regulator of acetoin/glycerol metabolism